MSIQHDSDRDPADALTSGEPTGGDPAGNDPEDAAAPAGAPEVADDPPGSVELESARPEAVEARPGHGLPAYRPPPSPAYAPPSGPGTVAVPTTPPPVPADTGTEPARSTAERRLGWQLLIAGLFLVLVAGIVVTLAIQSGGGTDAHAFGEVSAVTGDVTVRPGVDADVRDLEVGDEVVAGWQVDATGGAAATIDLAGGGMLRIDSGARLRFVDLAIDPDTGERARTSEPAVDLRGGRAWLVPGSPADDGAAVQAHIPDGVVETERHPVALDCTEVCTVEAPTGGVTVTTDEGHELTPTVHELLKVGPGPALDLSLADAASPWALQNLDADERAGLSQPEADDRPGIVDTAVVDGTYAVAIRVVGPPTGDAIPAALQYPEGETYALDLAVDGSGCDVPPCSVPITSEDGLSGTAQVRGGEVAFTFALPINCLDETHTSVVVPGIGNTAVNATLAVEAVDFDGERWHVRRITGTGTIAATMSVTCNAGDVLGTSTSPITIAGS
jgi:hypothetical protein